MALKFRSRTEITDRIPNKYDAVIAISQRAKMLVEGRKRLIDANDPNVVKVAMEEIATGALNIEVDK